MATKKGSKGTIRGRARASLPDSYKEAPRHAKLGGKTSLDERVEITRSAFAASRAPASPKRD